MAQVALKIEPPERKIAPKSDFNSQSPVITAIKAKNP